MRYYLALVAVLVLISVPAFADDGTMEAVPSSLPDNLPPQAHHPTDSTYVLTPFESATVSVSQVWRDNRHRAYYSSSLGHIYGSLLFDVSDIPDNSTVQSMTLRCYLENAFSSPRDNPVVDVYWCHNDNWDRSTVQAGAISLDTLLVDSIPFTSYVQYYDFVIDVAAHDWNVDLQDNRICFAFKNDVTYYSYVYFFGAYGSPTGPPPELTITVGPSGPVSLTLTPLNPPIQLPAGGGSFNFTCMVENTTDSLVTFDAWTKAILPNGSFFGPILERRNLRLNAQSCFTRTLRETVPGAAPPGNYVYKGYLGNMPNDVWAEDDFPFSKMAGESGFSQYLGWQVTGWDETPAVVPAGIEISASPNPFNPATTIDFYLPAAGNMELAVFDVSGREIARLAEGFYPQGSHQAEFDASALSSGIYFARMNTGGSAIVQKLLLVK